MGSSSGASPTIYDSFQQPTNPETLTPNFGQVGPYASGQPAPGFEGFPAPNGFSEFFTPGMPTMVSSPYIPGTGSPSSQLQMGPGTQIGSSPPSGAPASTSPDMVTAFGPSSSGPSSNLVMGPGTQIGAGTGAAPSTGPAATVNSMAALGAGASPGTPEAFNPAMFDQAAGGGQWGGPNSMAATPFGNPMMGSQIMAGAKAQSAGMPTGTY